MCFGGGAGDAAAQARAAEEARQARIRAGTDTINQTFEKFDKPYYEGITKASNDYYLPQVDQQYNEARNKLVLALGGRGILNSSEGAKQIGKISEDYNRKRTAYSDQGVNLANDYRGKVEQNRGELLNQLSASADPAAAAASASARADMLTAPPSFSPIGDLFSNLARYGATGIMAERAGYPGFRTGLFNNATSGQGTSKMINA